MVSRLLRGYDVILASGSPRRRELLGGLGVDFKVRILPGIDESYPPGLPPPEIPGYIAGKKADAYFPSMQANELIITADTVVVLDGGILEKPSSRAEAIRMLHRLSGRTHEVVTGVVIMTRCKRTAFSVASSVDFATLEEDEIRYYVDAFSPFDKAGGYGIQEWIGYIGVQGIRGSFHNVMGLPVQRLYQELKRF